MKVILYMAITANGLVAKVDDDTDWISSEEWDAYSATTRKAGNLIVGHRTYDILTKQPEFSEFKDVKIVVVATQPVRLVSNGHTVAPSPKEALQNFAGEEEVVVAGGGSLNASFLKEGFVDEIYLDIEPVMFAKGIPLAHGQDFELRLKLLASKKISSDCVQLHYSVVK